VAESSAHPSEPRSIAVVGVGSIGGAVAAQLCEHTAHRVVFCSPRAPDCLRLTLPPELGPEITARPAAAWRRPEAARGPVDWLLLACKAHQVEAAAPWLEALAGDETVVAILQNGVEHEQRVRPYAPRGRLLPVVVALPANRRSPDHVVQSGRGRLTVPDHEDGRAFAGLFEPTSIRVDASAAFLDAAWTKLCMNAVGGISALTDKPLGAAHTPELEALARGLARECIEVGRAEGARLDDSLEDGVIALLFRPDNQRPNSILDDRRAGRPLEYDARNAVIGRLAARHGIATPLSTALTALLTGLSAAGRPAPAGDQGPG